VTVGELQLLLTDLGKFLRAAEAARVVGELEYFTAKLQPFRDQKLKAFADFLTQAEAAARGIPAPKKAAARGKSSSDPAAVEEACQRVLVLYDRVIDPSVTLEQIEAAMDVLQDVNPSKAHLDELGRKMGFAQRFKSKGDVLQAIRQGIVGRKGAFDRVHA
jgi:hypothetical protein